MKMLFGAQSACLHAANGDNEAICPPQSLTHSAQHPVYADTPKGFALDYTALPVPLVPP